MCGQEKLQHSSPSDLAMDEASRGFGDLFRCLICLDLVFKPLVQPCGHVFCFWCVYRAMTFERHLQCSLCRRASIHFPRVCAMLHHFLKKALPEDYSARAHEIQEMEELEQIFSPRIPDSPQNFRSPREKNQETPPGPSTDDNQSWPFTSLKSGAIPDAERNAIMVNHSATMEVRDRDQELELNVQQQELDIHDDEGAEGHGGKITADDFPCTSCNRLLYRPVVLNCGQAFCESCVTKSHSSISCSSCRVPHPGGSISVCLELHHYLERAFPAHYQDRKEEVLRRSAPETKHMSEGSMHATINVCLEEERELRDAAGQLGHNLDVHQRVGCDGCGMFPIVGDRYKCRDCSEKVGYDLCGVCHSREKSDGAAAATGTVVHHAGRFNQQHRPDHRMEEVAAPEHLDCTSRSMMMLIDLNLQNGLIQRRRQLRMNLQEHWLLDLDDYIDSFV